MSDEDGVEVCQRCGFAYKTDGIDRSDAAQEWIYCSASCEHEAECADEECEYPDVHAAV